MTLEDLRKKVIYQNSLDIWIGLCGEKNIRWDDTVKYKKFIEYLYKQNLNMKKFPLCVSESDSSLKENIEKSKFAESLSEINDQNSATYTIKLSDSTIDVLRRFRLD